MNESSDAKSKNRIGYLGVDILNNATICNELEGLFATDLDLEIVSIYRVDRPTFHRESSLQNWSGRIGGLYPLRPFETVAAVLLAPFLFGLRFWTTLGSAVSFKAEGIAQKARILGHFLPALVLAYRWRRRGIGHIHAHWAHTATTIAMHTSGLLGVGFSFTGHANDLFVHRVGLVGKLKKARFTVCISEFHRQFYLARGAEPERLPVVYCGIDTIHYQSKSSSVANPPRIVSVGRLVEKKGFVDLILACGKLRDRGVDFVCEIAGSGPEEARLRDIVAKLDLRSQVTITGRAVLQEELPHLLASATLFALPCVRDRDADMDGLPQVLIEAMACGVPCVSTRLVGIPDLVRDRRNGRLVDPGDVEGLATAIEWLISESRSSDRLSTRARAWSQKTFGRAETVRRLRALFLDAISHPDGSAPSMRFEAARGSERQYLGVPIPAREEKKTHSSI